MFQGVNMPFGNVLSSNDGAMGDTGIVLQSPTYTPCKRVDGDMVYALLSFYGMNIPLVAERFRNVKEKHKVLAICRSTVDGLFWTIVTISLRPLSVAYTWPKGLAFKLYSPLGRAMVADI